jgi:sugar phosphate isomerase/epimerase
MRLSLNTITTKSWTLPQVIEACARHGIPGIAPWRDVLQAAGVEAAAKQIRDAGLTVTGLCRGGMFTQPGAIEDNRRAIAEAHAIGARCLVVLGGGLAPGSKDLPGARAMVRDGLGKILPEARAAGVTLALEPLHPMTCADRSVLSTLGQALDLCDELGEGTGVALDVYHVWWDPDLARQIRRAGKRIVAFHVCDWKVPTTDTVFDRGIPGEGVIDIPAIRRAVVEAGYAGGFAEVEVLSTRWWAHDPDDLVARIKAAHATAV